MRRTALLILVAALLILPVLALAQEDDPPPPNTVILPCTDEEMDLIQEGVLLSLQVYYPLRQDIIANDDASAMPRLRRQADALQQEWHATIYPEMPRCTLAVELNGYLGRMYDELLVVLLYLELGDTTGNDHLDVYLALEEDFNAFVDRMSE